MQHWQSMILRYVHPATGKRELTVITAPASPVGHTSVTPFHRAARPARARIMPTACMQMKKESSSNRRTARGQCPDAIIKLPHGRLSTAESAALLLKMVQ